MSLEEFDRNSSRPVRNFCASRPRGADGGRAGWQSNARSRQVYERGGLLYASDTRCGSPFFRASAARCPDPEIPSTAADIRPVMAGRVPTPDRAALSVVLRSDRPNVFQAASESRHGLPLLFRQLLTACREPGVESSGLGRTRGGNPATRPRFPCATRCWPKSTAAVAWWPRRRPGQFRILPTGTHGSGNAGSFRVFHVFRGQNGSKGAIFLDPGKSTTRLR